MKMPTVLRRSTATLAALLLGACATNDPGVPAPATNLGAVPAPAPETSRVEPVPPGGVPAVSERRYPADPKALALIRKADSLMYRPTDAGLRAVRCKAEYRVGLGTVRTDTTQVAYEMTAPGRSSMSPPPDPEVSKWLSSTGLGHCKRLLDDLFDGPRLERRVEAYELAMREEDGKPFVLATLGQGEPRAVSGWIDLRFRADGLLDQDGPGDRTVHPFCSRRTRFTYQRQGALFRRWGGAYFDDSNGFETFTYATFGGIVVPTKYASTDSGFNVTLTISDVEVNPPDLVAPVAEKPR